MWDSVACFNKSVCAGLRVEVVKAAHTLGTNSGSPEGGIGFPPKGAELRGSQL